MLLLLLLSPHKFKSGAEAVAFMISTADALIKVNRAEEFVRSVINREDRKHAELIHFMTEVADRIHDPNIGMLPRKKLRRMYGSIHDLLGSDQNV